MALNFTFNLGFERNQIAKSRANYVNPDKRLLLGTKNILRPNIN